MRLHYFGLGRLRHSVASNTRIVRSFITAFEPLPDYEEWYRVTCSLLHPFFDATHFGSYLSYGLFPSWMFIPYGHIFLFSNHPRRFSTTPNHSLLVAVYWYPFFTFLSPTIFHPILFSHFVIPSYSFNKWNVLCSASCICLWSQRMCFLSVLCVNTLQKLFEPRELNGYQRKTSIILDSRQQTVAFGLCWLDFCGLLYTDWQIWRHAWSNFTLE